MSVPAHAQGDPCRCVWLCSLSLSLCICQCVSLAECGWRQSVRKLARTREPQTFMCGCACLHTRVLLNNHTPSAHLTHSHTQVRAATVPATIRIKREVSACMRACPCVCVSVLACSRVCLHALVCALRQCCIGVCECVSVCACSCVREWAIARQVT